MQTTYVDSQWLTCALKDKGIFGKANVLKIERTDFDHIPSYLSRIARFSLEYDKECDAPKSIIVKVQPDKEPFKSVEQLYLAFEREIYFYENVAPKLPNSFALPRCYFTLYNTKSHPGILVLEDMSYLAAGDQIKGLTFEQVLEATRRIAILHATFWDKKLKELSWLAEKNYMMINRYSEFFPFFKEKYQNQIDPESLAIGESIAQSLDELLILAATRPQSLVHCDLRADNLRFGKNELVIFDWQLITKALPGFDLGRLLGENSDLTKDEQTNLVSVWHETLCQFGVSQYSREDALFDYKLGLALATHVPVINAAMLKDANPRTEKLVDLMALRFFKCAKSMELGNFVSQAQS
ncbi:MAG: phosphotransferase [Candidatus Melainabacteria bacterium]|nr:phosphotransferase [Candidatus Melainabacteria bacterium]